MPTMPDNSNMNHSQEAAEDLSSETRRATDQRCKRQSKSRRRSRNYRQNCHLSRYDLSNPRPSTSQSSMRRNNAQAVRKRSNSKKTSQEKLNIIKRICTGKSKASVSRETGVPESTLRGWCKAAEKIFVEAKIEEAAQICEHTLMSISDNSDQPGSSFLTPTQNTPGTSANRVNEEPEAGPAPKRVKLENNLISATAAGMKVNNTSISAQTRTMSNDPSYTYFNNLFDKDPDTFMFLFNTVMKVETLLSSSRRSLPAANFTDNLQLHRYNDMLASMMMTNILPTMLVNDKRNNHNNVLELASTMGMPTEVITGRQNKLSSNVENSFGSVTESTNTRTFSVPSTSADDGNMINNTSTKSSEDRKKLNTVICQQHVSSVPAYDMGEIISNNAMNNDNIDHVDNETTNERSASSLPPGFYDMLTCCTNLVEWLETYGSSIYSFQGLSQIRRILDKMKNWAKSNLRKVPRKAS